MASSKLANKIAKHFNEIFVRQKWLRKSFRQLFKKVMGLFQGVSGKTDTGGPLACDNKLCGIVTDATQNDGNYAFYTR